MADRPTRGDDDETCRLPEVTVPPWLRTGPGPDSSLAGVPAVDRSADVAGGAGSSRADGRADEPVREAPPNRITLGAGAGAGAGAPASAGSGPARTAGVDVDDLSSLPLGSIATEVPRPVDEPPRSPVVLDRRPVRFALLAAAGVAVLGGSAVLGFVVTRGAVSPSEEAVTGCAEVSEAGRVVGAGPGSLDTPAGAVLAFDHAYYVERSAAKAFEAVSPSSRMTEEQLRVEGVERVPEGTTHCVEARELSPTLLEVDLTEYPPEADPVLIRQRVRLAENPDGTWGIVSITPAG
ncbi:hypothetical protein [Dietzia massiliensis]|uniref:hypothetical protein n=1 Tax=Dietzia massiliensis TaxID=2697499 RepID=UPI001F293314|nr:hypothetical protein [Dietzia massiliensis]